MSENSIQNAAASSKEPEDSNASSIPGFSSITEFSNEGIRKVLSTTKAFQALPSAGPSWDLHKSYPQFNRAMKMTRNKLVPLMAALLKHANIPPEDFKAGDVDEKFDFLVDSNDDMLERIGRALDEADGLFKKAETIVVNQGSVSAALRPPGTWGKREALEEQSGPSPNPSEEVDPKSRNIKKAVFKRTVKEKPQLKFKTPVDNSISPFIPKLKEKPNSIKPLSILPEYNSKEEEYYGHPYLVELNRWEPLDSMLVKADPIKPKILEDTLVEINTTRDLEQLLRDLYSVSELAIDLEHHSYRTFLGFTCLMQISTRDKDYVIDALSLREHLHILNEIFTNPKIMKVFHGSTSDIEWLQKDFGLYVVGMFDTQIAAKLLGHQQLGLQALLDKYCGISQDKAFQLADWRIRPLPEDMKHYARQDTHSLLYIYDLMKNELIEAGNLRNNLLIAAYDQSKLLCLKRYEKPGNNPKLALRKMRRSLNNRQVYAFMELYKWRDSIAREKDESIAYVLPNHMLLMISEQLPKEMTGILACCDPVPPSVHSGLGVMHKIVTSARELPLQEHTSEEKSEKRQKLKDWVVLMNSVHDVGLSEITKINQDIDDFEEDEQPSENMDVGLDLKKFQELQANRNWPMPLPEHEDIESVIISQNSSIFFNSKIRRTAWKESQSKSTTYKIDVAATPFDRYQLSKEIMDILQNDPKALDMENPVVKAVYETAFCDSTEQDEDGKGDEVVPKPEKVFTEGEFIPFNPLAQSGSSKSKKRKRTDEWDDSAKPGKSADNSTPFKMGVEEESDASDCVDQSQSHPNSRNPKENSAMENFMSVSERDGRNPKNKKRNKKGNLLKKLKNTFSKKKGKRNHTPNDEPVFETINNSNSFPTSKRRKTEDTRHRSQGSNLETRSKRVDKREQETPNINSTRHGKRGNRGKNDRGRGRGRGRGGGNFFDFKGRGGSSRSMTFK